MVVVVVVVVVIWNLLNSSNAGLIDEGPFPCFRGGHRLWPFSVPLSYIPSPCIVMSSVLCPQIAFQAPQHFRFSKIQTACDVYKTHLSL